MARRKELTPAEKRKLKKQLEEAADSVGDPEAEKVIDQAPGILDKLDVSKIEWIQLLAQRARLLYYLVVDWWNGDYQPSKRVIAIAVAALLYLVSPFDLIPDFLPVVGWLDDAAVLTFAVKMLHDELQRYARKMDIDPEDFDLVLA